MRRVALPLTLLTAGLVASSASAAPDFLMDEKADLPGVTGDLPVPPKKPADSVAILVLSGDEAGVAFLELDDAARRAIERETALQVLSPEVLSSIRTNLVRDCAGDPECFVRELRAKGISTDLLLTVSVTSIGEGQLLGLLLIDTRRADKSGEKVSIGEVAEELPPGVSPLRAMPDYLAKVFPGEVWGQVASLQVESNAENAEVLVGQSSCVTPCKLDRIYPGKYPVVIKKTGFQPWAGSVDLRAGQTSRVEASLVEEESSLTESPLFWGAVGAGAIAAGVVAFLLLSPDDGPVTICIARTEDQCNQ